MTTAAETRNEIVAALLRLADVLNDVEESRVEGVQHYSAEDHESAALAFSAAAHDLARASDLMIEVSGMCGELA